MFHGKLKAVTFSYDDGVTQDVRFVELLDKYGLKCTFNLNTELFGQYNRLLAAEVAAVYKNHEVAVHTLTHPHLNQIAEDEEVIREIEQDRLNLEQIVGYPIYGMAYPYGNGATDARILDLVRTKTAVQYARGTDPSYNFEPQTDLINFAPTVHHNDFDRLFALAQEFIDLKPDSPKIFYIWGHSYEFDYEDGKCWDKMEKFCKLISGHDDIFYGTNTEVLLGRNNKAEPLGGIAR